MDMLKSEHRINEDKMFSQRPLVKSLQNDLYKYEADTYLRRIGKFDVIIDLNEADKTIFRG